MATTFLCSGIRITHWRLKLSNEFNTRTAHYVSLSLILCSFLISLVVILFSLFSCEKGIKENPKVILAEETLRWTDVAFLALMVIEVIVRVLLVGFLTYFRPIIHIFDAIILVTLLVVESAVSEESATATAGLLISLRILRVIKQLEEVGSISEVMKEEEFQEKEDALKKKIAELELGYTEVSKNFNS
jgi:hypothetical protein